MKSIIRQKRAKHCSWEPILQYVCEWGIARLLGSRSPMKCKSGAEMSLPFFAEWIALPVWSFSPLFHGSISTILCLLERWDRCTSSKKASNSLPQRYTNHRVFITYRSPYFYYHTKLTTQRTRPQAELCNVP